METRKLLRFPVYFQILRCKTPKAACSEGKGRGGWGCSTEQRYDVTPRKTTAELFYRQVCDEVTLPISDLRAELNGRKEESQGVSPQE